METRVVRVGALEEWLAEVPPSGMQVRLSLTERLLAPAPLPGKSLELHLQGVNDLGEIVWLMESQTINWVGEGPWSEKERSVYEGMKAMPDLVRGYLKGLGYEVRGGSYGISKDIEPVRGEFECVRWQKGEDETYTLAARDEASFLEGSGDEVDDD